MFPRGSFVCARLYKLPRTRQNRIKNGVIKLSQDRATLTRKSATIHGFPTDWKAELSCKRPEDGDDCNVYSGWEKEKVQQERASLKKQNLNAHLQKQNTESGNISAENDEELICCVGDH